MGKGSGSAGKQDITEYRMSIHFGVALEVDSVNAFWVDDKPAWRGSASVNTAIPINLPDLYGGQKKEGGLIGTVQVLLGRPDQVLPDAVASRYGRTPTTCPAFRGTTTVMFHGSTTVSTGYQGGYEEFPTNWGGTTNVGFVWKCNSPVIAQKVEVEVTRAPKGLHIPDALIGADANPAHMIYEILTNDHWGMGGAVELIDAASFTAAGLALKAEGFGLSMIWTRQTTIEAFVTEVVDHIHATLFVNPNTGLLSLKLLRDDYDIATLREITPLNATLSNFKRRSVGEIINEITVTWTNPVTELEESVTAQDIASIQSQGGEKVSGARPFYGIRNLALATKILARELRASTAPLVSADAKLDRSAWDVLPGEVMKLSWPRRGVNSIIVRAGKVNYGKPRDSAIKVSLLQDVFSLSRPPIKIAPPSDWTNPAVDPSPLTMQLFTVPSFFVRNDALQNSLVTLTEPEVLVGALTDSISADSLDYELVGETTTSAGGTVVTSKGAMTLTPLAVLTSAMPAAVTSTIPAALYPNISEAPLVGGFIFIGTSDANQEIALVTARTSTGWTISRGVLDTVPKAWSAGTYLWSVNPGARIVDSQTIHAAGEVVEYRGLDRTALGLLPFADAPAVSTTLTNRPHLPLRPANVKVNGTAFGPVAIGGNASITITWATRNRTLEDTQVVGWTEGPVIPDYRQETVVRCYNGATGAFIVEYASLWLENELVLPKTGFDRYSSVRFEVLSRVDDLSSLQGHSITVTGFANNAGAGAPPTPVTRTEPPSIYAAPGLGAFFATASESTIVGDAHVPTILITGMQDNPAAEALVVRFALTGTTAWVESAPHVLRQEAVTYAVSQGIQGNVAYDVQVAYVVRGIISRWRSLGSVTTSPLISDTGSSTPPGVPTGLGLTSPSAVFDASTGRYLSKVVATWTPADTNAVAFDVELTESGQLAVVTRWPSARAEYPVRASVEFSARVRSVGRSGTVSAYSTSVSVTSVGDTAAPAVPTWLSAVASNIGSVFLTWTAPADADVSKVVVYVNTTNNSSTATRLRDELAAPSGVNGTTHSGLTSGDVRYYWLKAVDVSGNQSGFSAVQSVTVPILPNDVTPPAVPTGLGLTSTVTIDNVTGQPVPLVVATWTANSEPDFSNYEIEVTAGGGNPLVTPVGPPESGPPRYQFRGVSGVAYSARVRAVDRSGNRSAFNTTPATVTGASDGVAPGAPTPATPTVSFGSINLSWTNTSDSDLAKMQIWVNTTNVLGSATPLTTVNASPGGSGSFAHTGLAVGLTRYYWLRSVDSSGNVSSFSASVTGTTPAIGFTDFASSLAAPLVAANDAAATALISGGNTAGKFYLNTTDLKLYRGTGSGWTRAADGADIIADSIIVGALQAGAVRTRELASDAVTASKLAITDMTNLIQNQRFRVGVDGANGLDGVSRLTAPGGATIYAAGPDTSWPSAYGLVLMRGIGSAELSAVLAASSWESGTTDGIPTAMGDEFHFSATVFQTTGGAVAFDLVHMTNAGAISLLTAVAGDNASVATGRIVSSAATSTFAPLTGYFKNTVGNGSVWLRVWNLATTAGTPVYVWSPLLRRKNNGQLIVDGTITTTHVAAATFTGGEFRTDASLPGTISVGTTGVTIGTVQTQANNPIPRINAQSTTIDPGRILIAGSTTLDDWRDVTDIKGGKIKTNSIDATRLSISSRGIELANIFFSYVPNTSVTYTSGTIVYPSDTVGVYSEASITGATLTWSGGFDYIYWIKGESALRTTTSMGTANAQNAVVVATYQGGSLLNSSYGRTMIEGDVVRTGTLHANRIVSYSLTATQVQAGTFTGAEFSTTAGLPGTITVNGTGVNISDAATWASNPAARINTGPTTQITPGRILISGSTSLDNWRTGTEINGSSIATDTIVTRHLQARSISVDKLRVGANDNLLPDGAFSGGTIAGWSRAVAPSGSTLSVAANTGNDANWPGYYAALFIRGASAGELSLSSHNVAFDAGSGRTDGIPTAAGDQFYVEAVVYQTQANAGTIEAILVKNDGSIVVLAASSPIVGSAVVGSALATSATTQFKTIGATIINNTAPGRIYLRLNHVSIVNGSAAYFWNVSIKAKNKGELIVDGAITAGKITVISLSAISAALGTVISGRVQNAANTTFLDLDNGRQQMANSSSTTYVERSGNLGGGLTRWMGLASVTIGSETVANSKWCQSGVDGKIYYGGDELTGGGSSVQVKQVNFGAPIGPTTAYPNAGIAVTDVMIVPTGGKFYIEFPNAFVISDATAGASGPPTGNMRVIMYHPAGNVQKGSIVYATTTSTSWTSFDATGMTVAFDNPSAGAVQFQLQCEGGSPNGFSAGSVNGTMKVTYLK